MKHLLFVAGLICSLGIQAQLTGISVEIYAEHDGIAIPELDGFTTYHVYANTTNVEDFVSAVYADSDSPGYLSSLGTVFQSEPSGYDFGTGPNPLFFPTFPNSQYDSWFSIGMMSSEDEGDLNNIGMENALADFNSTGNFYIDDAIGGSWFVPGFPCNNASATDFVLDSLVFAPYDYTNPCLDYIAEGMDTLCVDSVFHPYTELELCQQNPAYGGADNKVLLAQITTDAPFYGLLNVQVFVGGLQSNNTYYNGLTFSSDPNVTFGCTNPLDVINYDATADYDDFSCVLPCTIAIQASATSPTCFGYNDGALDITATGAQGSDYYYLGEDDITPSNFGGFDYLLPGDYYALVEDAAGCRDSLWVTIPATEEVLLTAILTQAISCNDLTDAIITISDAMGGDGNLLFHIQDSTETSTTETSFSGLGEGIYTIIATDGNGCMGSSIATSVNNPSAISVFIGANSPASCADIADGVITVSAFGGWAPGSITYSVNGDSGLSSPLYVPGGTFTVIGTDINGCTGSSDEVVVGPDAININASATAVACTNDSNGVVSWAPVGGFGLLTVIIESDTMTGTSYEDLNVGTYTILVSDGNDCTASVDVEVLNAVPVVATATSTSVTCSGLSDGVVTVAAEGGTGAFQFSDNGNTFAATNEFDDLSADDYTFYAQDQNGCISEADVMVMSPDPIVIGGFPSEGEDTGNAVIDISVTGGTPGYSYEWTGPGVNGTTTADLDGLSSGTYTVEVTDDAGCSEVATFNVITGIYELAGGVEAQIFPNPSTGLFQVQWSGWTGGAVEFSVIDARGRQVTQGVWTGAGTSFLTTLDLSGVENGLYRLNVVSNGIPTSIQLLKTN